MKRPRVKVNSTDKTDASDLDSVLRGIDAAMKRAVKRTKGLE